MNTLKIETLGGLAADFENLQKTLYGKFVSENQKISQDPAPQASEEMQWMKKESFCLTEDLNLETPTEILIQLTRSIKSIIFNGIRQFGSSIKRIATILDNYLKKGQKKR